MTLTGYDRWLEAPYVSASSGMTHFERMDEELSEENPECPHNEHPTDRSMPVFYNDLEDGCVECQNELSADYADQAEEARIDAQIERLKEERHGLYF